MRAVARHQLFLPFFAALVAAAWLALWLWDASPYGRYLHHGQWAALGPADLLAQRLCRAFPAGAAPLVALLAPPLLHASAWLLMIAAMMLPTTLSLLEVFRRLTAARTSRWWLLALVVLGYVGAWLAFGLVAHLLDGGLHVLAGRLPWLAFHGWLVGASVVALAGAYQFSDLKYRCLDRCRSPLMFVSEHWRGGRPGRDSLLLGLHHGAFCVGCCWALMLLMFTLGAGSLGWMMALAAVMAAEKNLSWGRHLGKPVGISLILWAGVILLQHFP
jgi:predicted metal-binding membrane protein